MKKIFTVMLLLMLMIVVLPTNAFADTIEDRDKYNPDSFPSQINKDFIRENSSMQRSGDDLNIEELPEDEKAPASLGDQISNTSVSTAAAPMAIMRIFASNGGKASSLGTSGHAFLTIKNVQSYNISVGSLSVPPGKTVTVGTWGNKSEHKGLWYNLEGYFQRRFQSYSSAVSLRVDLSSRRLATVSRNIRNNDSWSALSNCSTFATKIFNSVCTTTVKAGLPNTPIGTMNSIKSYKNLYATGISIPYFGSVHYGEPIKRSSSY